MAIIEVNSPKHGHHEVLIDDEDRHLLEGLKVYVWTSDRHHTFYAMTTVNGKQVRIHRLIMKATNPKVSVDHINGNGLDNRKVNLRATTQQGNNCNARKRKNARTSTYKGVHKDKWGKWKAQIQYKKVKYSLGSFNTEIEAAKAYNRKAKELHGEYAYLNDIPPEEE